MEQQKQEDHKLRIPKRFFYNRVVELYVWAVIAILVLLPVIFYSSKMSTADFIDKFYNSLLIGAFIILFPILFKLIFGKLPFEYLRLRTVLKNNIIIENQIGKDITLEYTIPDQKDPDFRIQCINESKAISERIFLRSGVYLLVGCLIAFIGVGIFYSPLFTAKTTTTEVTQRLLDYLPRFGALFFIEFIAFFFLKQYRIMLEEYRYYEAIKRKRQDNLNLTNLIIQYKKDTNIIEIIKNNTDLNVSNKLSAGQTTDSLELEKLLGQDLDLFGKLTEFVKVIKTK